MHAHTPLTNSKVEVNPGSSTPIPLSPEPREGEGEKERKKRRQSKRISLTWRSKQAQHVNMNAPK